MSRPKALELLELSDNFTDEDLKKAWRKKSFEWHPDRNKLKNAEKMFVAINQAHNYLSNPPDTINDEPLEDFGERPWRHNYYTPIEEYDDLERWEYYTNPEIQKSYEQDFESEQEYYNSQQEEMSEGAYDADKSNSEDNVYIIQEALNDHDTKTLLKAYNEKLDKKLEILNINRKDIDRKRFTKHDWLNNEIDTAIHRIIIDDRPEDAYLLFKAIKLKGQGGDLSNFDKNPIDVMSAEQIIELFNNDEIQLDPDIRNLKHENLKIIHENIKTKVIDFIKSNMVEQLRWGGPKDTFNYYSFFWAIGYKRNKELIDIYKNEILSHGTLDKKDEILLKILNKLEQENNK